MTTRKDVITIFSPLLCTQPPVCRCIVANEGERKRRRNKQKLQTIGDDQLILSASIRCRRYKSWLLFFFLLDTKFGSWQGTEHRHHKELCLMHKTNKDIIGMLHCVLCSVCYTFYVVLAIVIMVANIERAEPKPNHTIKSLIDKMNGCGVRACMCDVWCV